MNSVESMEYKEKKLASDSMTLTGIFDELSPSEWTSNRESTIFGDYGSKGANFIDSAMYMMDQFYSDWWSASTNKETVCIPACLDVDKNRYLGPTDCRSSNFDSEMFSKKERQFAGQSAEDTFLNSFQQMKIGGVLLFGFDTMEFAMRRKMQKLFKKREIRQFECDFLFLHPSFGVIIIELKATRQRIDETSHVYQKAVDFVTRTKKQIPTIFELLSGEKFNLPIFGAVCFPFAKVGKFIPKNDIELIESCREDILKQFFMDRMLLQPLEEQHLAAFKIFTCALAGYRSMDFISPMHNALTIHRMIENQSFTKTAAKKEVSQRSTDINDPINSVFLTNEQLAVLHSTERRQIIFGPPGTGKTLMLLNKAMKAAQIERLGKVRVIVFNKMFCNSVRKFFELNNNENKKIIRFPVIGYQLNDTAQEDDIFIDEASFGSEIVAFLEGRLKAIGTTMVAITGYSHPLQIVHAREDIERHKLTSYCYVELNTVIRGTSSIVNYWKQEFPTSFHFYLGHNITGSAVRKVKLKTVDSVLGYLRETISQARIIDTCKACVITENRKNCELIKIFLSSCGTDFCSLDEQVNDNNSITVAEFTETLSFEWPLVFIVSLTCINLPEEFLLIAASRAIASLTFIERDYKAVQRDIDELLMLEQPPFDLSYMELSKLFKDYPLSSKLNYSSIDADLFDTHLAITRHNLMPKELRSIEAFSDCVGFFDCLSVISKSEILIQMFLEEQDICRLIERYQEKVNQKTGRLPKFVKILLGNWSDKVKFEREKIMGELVHVLSATYSKNTIDFDKKSEIFVPAVGWNFLKNVITLFEREKIMEKLVHILSATNSKNTIDFDKKSEILVPVVGWIFLKNVITFLISAFQ